LLAQNSGWDISVAEVEDVGSEYQPALFGIERVDFGVSHSKSIPGFVQTRSCEVVCLFLRSRDFVGQAWNFVREEDWPPAVDDWPACFPLDAGDESLSAKRGGAVHVAAGEEDDVSLVVGRLDEGSMTGGLDCEIAVVVVVVVQDRVVGCWFPRPFWGF
jgi:hypothetical protein